MNKITACVIVGIVCTLMAICGISYVSNANYGVEAETGLTKQLNENKNVRSNYFAKVQEVVQVQEIYADDFQKVVTASIEGRYGKEGSKATWQFITEHNPTLDPALYVKIQQIIEAGRNEFKNSQSVLLDKKATYETNLGYVWKGMWLHMAGYPKIDLNSIKIIITSETNEAYETGVDKPLQLRTKQK